MLARVKFLTIGLVIGVIVGLWCGVNIGKGRSIYENPFKDRSIQERVIESSGDLLQKSGEALKERLDH